MAERILRNGVIFAAGTGEGDYAVINAGSGRGDFISENMRMNNYFPGVNNLAAFRTFSDFCSVPVLGRGSFNLPLAGRMSFCRNNFVILCGVALCAATACLKAPMANTRLR